MLDPGKYALSDFGDPVVVVFHPAHHSLTASGEVLQTLPAGITEQ